MILTADAFKTWLFDDGIGKAFSPRCDYYNLIRNPKWVPGKFSTALDFGNGSSFAVENWVFAVTRIEQLFFGANQ